MGIDLVFYLAYLPLIVLGGVLIATGRIPVLFALAFLSAVAYSVPLFFGFAIYPEFGGVFTPVPLELGVYVVNSVVIATVLAAGALKAPIGRRVVAHWHLSGTHYAGWIALALAFALLAHAVLAGGSALFSDDKNIVLKATGRTYSLAIVCAFVAVAFAVEFRSRLLLALAFAVLVFDLYIGFRAWTVMAILLVGVLRLTRETVLPNSSRKEFARLVWILAGLVLVAFFYKGIFPDIKAGDLVAAFGKLSDPIFYLESIVLGEPFIVQAILNEIIRVDYSVSGEHLLGIALLLFVLTPELGFKVKFFNEHFQEDLFPGTVDFMGMGNSFWAEAFSVGGALGVAIYLSVFVTGLWLGNRLLSTRSATTRAVAASLLVPWAFYIQRNELTVQLNFERQILIAALAAVLGSMVLSWLRHAARGKFRDRDTPGSLAASAAES